MKDAAISIGLVIALLCVIGLGVLLQYDMRTRAVRTALCTERGGVYINTGDGYCISKSALIDMEDK